LKEEIQLREIPEIPAHIRRIREIVLNKEPNYNPRKVKRHFKQYFPKTNDFDYSLSRNNTPSPNSTESSVDSVVQIDLTENVEEKKVHQTVSFG
jgi:hypothetical protein